MQTAESILTNVSGTFPNTVAVNASGAGATDGTEFIAAYINNFIFGFPQYALNYASITPSGVVESASASQIFESIQKGNGIGPGMYVQRAIAADPSVHGDRVLILSGQGVLRATYTALDNAVYVGDGNNPTASYFYHADDAAGTSRNTAGIYLILPPQNYTHLKQYSEANGDFTVTGTNWTTTNAVAVPYRESGGTWRMIFNIEGVFSAAVTNGVVNMSGVTFSFRQVVVGHHNVGSSNYRIGDVTAASNTITGINVASGGTGWIFAADVELDSIPTWADDFDYIWGITY